MSFVVPGCFPFLHSQGDSAVTKVWSEWDSWPQLLLRTAEAAHRISPLHSTVIRCSASAHAEFFLNFFFPKGSAVSDDNAFFCVTRRFSMPQELEDENRAAHVGNRTLRGSDCSSPLLFHGLLGRDFVAKQEKPGTNNRQERRQKAKMMPHGRQSLAISQFRRLCMYKRANQRRPRQVGCTQKAAIMQSRPIGSAKEVVTKEVACPAESYSSRYLTWGEYRSFSPPLQQYVGPKFRHTFCFCVA
jgi:hypothetical protein